MLLALTRAVPPSIDRCELTYLARTPIDYARAVEEHAEYEATLRELGCRVERLPDAPGMPDSVFVEDTAVVLDGLAVIARPGADSRRGEVDAIVAALRPHRRLACIEAPGTLDGGDVLVTPGRIFVGATPRTNDAGARQLASFVGPLGFDVVRVPATKCLHLKSAVCVLPPEGGSYGREVSLLPPNRLRQGNGESAFRRNILLINRDWIDAVHFDHFELVDVDPAEPAAANVLAIAGRVLCAREYPRPQKRLEALGFVTRTVPAGELAKAEGGVTCGSLILRAARPT